MPDSPFILMVAGEASGDQAAAPVVTALRRVYPRARILAVGGPRMREAGAEILFDYSELAVMGFAEVLKHLPRLLRRRREVKALLRSGEPDLFIPVDAPGFNLPLAREAKTRKIPTLYYIAPQVWAWGQGRVNAMRRDLAGLAVILPFEEAWFSEHGLEARFVGHPLAGRFDNLPAPGDPAHRIGLMPGSRAQEVSRHLPRLLKAVEILQDRRVGLEFSILEAGALNNEYYGRYLDDFQHPIKRFRGDSAEFFAQQDLLWASSGTATLEAALAGRPMVVLYRTGPLNYQLARRLVSLNRIALVNLVAERELVPELIQKGAEPENLALAMFALLTDEKARRRQRTGFEEIRTKLGSKEPGENVADMAQKILEGHER